ncbi:MAG: GNAT family N-acetyltransferase [Bacteroidota bacterium]
MEIKEITAQETYNIRKEELRKNMDLSTKFTGDLDKDTIHLGLFTDDKLVSILSLMKAGYKEFTGFQYQLRGMATLNDYQGKGFGRELVTRSIEIIKEKRADIVWCNARVAVLNFYKKQGFKTIGKEFDIPQIGGHFVMYKELND